MKKATLVPSSMFPSMFLVLFGCFAALFALVNHLVPNLDPGLMFLYGWARSFSMLLFIGGIVSVALGIYLILKDLKDID